MKKVFSKLLIISIVCAIISLNFCFASIRTDNFDFSTTKHVVNEANEMGSDNPGAGWYLLLGGGIAAIADMGEAIGILIFTILIPGFILFIIIISQCIARLVQIGEEKKWKNITSKIFTDISISLQFILVFILAFNLLLKLNKLLLGVALIVNIISIILYIKELSKIKKVTAKSITQENVVS